MSCREDVTYRKTASNDLVRKRKQKELERKWPHKGGRPRLAIRRDTDCEFTMIRPTPIVTQSDSLAHNRATLFNNLLPDQTAARWTQRWIEEPQTLFLEAQRPLWRWRGLRDYSAATTETCHHILFFSLITLYFFQWIANVWGSQIWLEPHFDLWEKEMWTVLVAKWSFVNHQQMLITNRPWFANHL